MVRLGYSRIGFKNFFFKSIHHRFFSKLFILSLLYRCLTWRLLLHTHPRGGPFHCRRCSYRSRCRCRGWFLGCPLEYFFPQARVGTYPKRSKTRSISQWKSGNFLLNKGFSLKGVLRVPAGTKKVKHRYVFRIWNQVRKKYLYTKCFFPVNKIYFISLQVYRNCLNCFPI